MTKDEKKMISEVARIYKLPAAPPNMSDPKVLDSITVSVIESCIDDLEAADAGVCASLAHASEIWTC
jgi:hypothetical protein